MSDILDCLNRTERRDLDRLAQSAGVDPSAMLPAIVSSYLTLYRDARAVLPADPLQGLSVVAAKRRAGVAS